VELENQPSQFSSSTMTTHPKKLKVILKKKKPSARNYNLGATLLSHSIEPDNKPRTPDAIFPIDIWHEIFLYIDLFSLHSMRATCKFFYKILSTHSTWNAIFGLGNKKQNRKLTYYRMKELLCWFAIRAGTEPEPLRFDVARLMANNLEAGSEDDEITERRRFAFHPYKLLKHFDLDDNYIRVAYYEENTIRRVYNFRPPKCVDATCRVTKSKDSTEEYDVYLDLLDALDYWLSISHKNVCWRVFISNFPSFNRLLGYLFYGKVQPVEDEWIAGDWLIKMAKQRLTPTLLQEVLPSQFCQVLNLQ
jgi:hypothetical protein